MALTIEVGFLFLSLLIVFLYLGYSYKNAFLILVASVLFFVFAALLWNGGLVHSVGSVINVSGSSYDVSTTYAPYSFGFSQNVFASLFAILGLFFFLQAISAFTRDDNPGGV